MQVFNSNRVLHRPVPEIDIQNDLNGDEVYRRLPEVNRINDNRLRQETVKAFVELCPSYFWEEPAAKYNHHPSHREELGLWLHTKRASTAYDRLCDSYVEQNLIDDFERDCGYAAILLHDMYKYGYPHKGKITKTHGETAARILSRETELPEEIIGCVRTHNGPWYEDAQPSNSLEQLHHLADMAASDVNAAHAVMDPCEELLDQFGDIETTK